MEWSEENSLLLIELYKEKRMLWDTAHPNHFNKIHRHHAWEEIGKRMATSGEECKKKMVILLASMRREKAKLRKSLRSGSEEKYKSKWFAFQSLQFMWENKVMEWNVVSSDRQEEYSGDDPEDEAATPEAAFPQWDNIPHKKMKTTAALSHSATTTAGQEHNKRDSFAVYGEFVGDSIRTLNNKRLQSWARHQINNILYIAEQASFQNSTDFLNAENLNVSINPSSIIPKLLHPGQRNARVTPSEMLISSVLDQNPSSTSPPLPSDTFKCNEIYIKQEPLYSNPPSPTQIT